MDEEQRGWLIGIIVIVFLVLTTTLIGVYMQNTHTEKMQQISHQCKKG